MFPFQFKINLLSILRKLFPRKQSGKISTAVTVTQPPKTLLKQESSQSFPQGSQNCHLGVFKGPTGNHRDKISVPTRSSGSSLLHWSSRRKRSSCTLSLHQEKQVSSHGRWKHKCFSHRPQHYRQPSTYQLDLVDFSRTTRDNIHCRLGLLLWIGKRETNRSPFSPLEEKKIEVPWAASPTNAAQRLLVLTVIIS